MKVDGIPDRTTKVSFERVDHESAYFLLDNGVVVFKKSVPAEAVGGVVTAYERHRKLQLPRRAAAKALVKIGLGDSRAHELIRAKAVEANAERLPIHMRCAQIAIDAATELNRNLFSLPEIFMRYGGRKELNLARFALSIAEEAFPPHQDSRGNTGLAYAEQILPTLWQIRNGQPEQPIPETPIAYCFETEPGDIVVLTERVGECPDFIPLVQGEREFFHDGSVIHGGLNFTGEPRYGLGLFHQEQAETI